MDNYNKLQRRIAEDRLEIAKDVIYRVVHRFPEAVDLEQFENQLKAIV